MHGRDLSGDLLLGNAAATDHERAQPLSVDDPSSEYPVLAKLALGEEPAGSSAGGEQPKFAIYRPGRGHVLVKFSPSGRTAEARRWRDLLRAEHHALEELRRNGRRAAVSTIHEFAGRVYLECPRFDRVGERGRAGLISLSLVAGGGLVLDAADGGSRAHAWFPPPGREPCRALRTPRPLTPSLRPTDARIRLGGATSCEIRLKS